MTEQVNLDHIRTSLDYAKEHGNRHLWVAEKDRRKNDESTIGGFIWSYLDPATGKQCFVLPLANAFRNSTTAVYLISRLVITKTPTVPSTYTEHRQVKCEPFYVAAWHWKESQVILHPMNGAPEHWRIDPPKACYHLWLLDEEN